MGEGRRGEYEGTWKDKGNWGEKGEVKKGQGHSIREAVKWNKEESKIGQTKTNPHRVWHSLQNTCMHRCSYTLFSSSGPWQELPVVNFTNLWRNIMKVELRLSKIFRAGN